MPSGNFHYYIVTKLNADVTFGTRQLHCYVVKLTFTSLYGKRQLDRPRIAPDWFPGTRLH